MTEHEHNEVPTATFVDAEDTKDYAPEHEQVVEADHAEQPSAENLGDNIVKAATEAAYAAVLESFQYGASDAGQDLSGLVRMIHAAYDVLSTPDRRRSYDELLAQEAEAADEELKSTLDAQPAAGTRYVQDVPAPLRAVFGPLAA